MNWVYRQDIESRARHVQTVIMFATRSRRIRDLIRLRTDSL